MSEGAQSSGLQQARARARQAAMAEGEVEGEVELSPQVMLCVGGHWYAVDALSVHRVVCRETITRVPGRPEHILGVAMVSDMLVPVVDLEKLLGRASSAGNAPVQTRPRLVVIGDSQRRVAVVADEARGIDALPTRLEANDEGLLLGESHHQGRHSFHLDVQALLAVGNDEDTSAR